MNDVAIITATRGIGLAISNHVKNLGLSSKTYGLGYANIGISKGLPAEKVDVYTDIALPYNLDEVPIEPARYLVWSTGAFLKTALETVEDDQIDILSRLHYSVPLQLIRRFHRLSKIAYHLIVIASCSSWRLREDEAIYCGLSAAKAAFARNIIGDLVKDRPGSKVMLINPGGVRTPFYDEQETEGAGFIDQAWLANYIWNAVQSQKNIFHELQILRKKPAVRGDLPSVEEGQKLPEVWSSI